MQRIPFSFSISSHARRKTLATVALVLAASSAAHAQPEGDSLMVPEESATGAGVTGAPIETAAQKADRADGAREERDRRSWRKAMSEMRGPDGATEKQNPAGTLAAYRSWLSQHGDLHPSVVAEAGVVVSRLQGRSGDKDGANGTLRSSLKRCLQCVCEGL